MAKSSKSHPTDADAGVRTPESGVGRLFAGLQANRPRRWRFQPPVRFLAIGTKSGITIQGKKTDLRKIRENTPPKSYLIISIAASGGTIIPHSRSTRKKRVRHAARQSRGGA